MKRVIYLILIFHYITVNATVIAIDENENIRSLYNQCIEEIKWEKPVLNDNLYNFISYCDVNIMVINFQDNSRKIIYLKNSNLDTIRLKIEKKDNNYNVKCENNSEINNFLYSLSKIDELKNNFDANFKTITANNDEVKKTFINTTLNNWENLYKNTKDEFLKNILLLDYAYFNSLGFYYNLNINVKKKYFKELINHIKPTSLLWKKRLNLLTYGFIATYQLSDYKSEYITEMLLHYPLRSEAEILISDILRWSYAENDTIFNFYMDLLENNKSLFKNASDLIKKYNFEDLLLNSKFPILELTDIETGETINFNKFQKGYYLIDFWATWCNPCIKELKKYDSILKNNKELNIITISVDEDIEKAKKFITNNTYMKNFINLWDPKNFKGYLYDTFNSNSIPYRILIKDGIIIMTNYQLTNTKMIENVFKLKKK